MCFEDYSAERAEVEASLSRGNTKKKKKKMENWVPDFEATKRKLLQSKCRLPSKMSLFHGATVTSYNFGSWIILKGTQPNSTSDQILIRKKKKKKNSGGVELEEVSLPYVCRTEAS